MMKFKVGDRVKYINNPNNYAGVFNVGDSLEIINIAGEKAPVYACIKDNPEVYEGFDAYELELINE